MMGLILVPGTKMLISSIKGTIHGVIVFLPNPLISTQGFAVILPQHLRTKLGNIRVIQYWGNEKCCQFTFFRYRGRV